MERAIDCRMALEILLTHFGHPGEQATEVEAAFDHISQCPTCWPKLGYLIRAVSSSEEDKLTCQECEDRLPDFWEASAAGHIQGPLWYPVVLHLSTCPHCSAEYKTLSDLMAVAEDGWDLGQAYDQPVDLSFLQPEPLQPVWRLDEPGQMVIRFSAALLSSWQSPAPATNLKHRDQSSRIIYKFSLKKGELEGFEPAITVEAKRNDPSHCRITVKVDLSDRSWPDLAGTEVILKRGELELDRQLTDAFGQVIFEEVNTADLPQLVFEILPPKP